MSARRPCDACGGMGADPQTSPFHHADCSFVRDGCDCAGCPACGGRGWQSDQMPVAESWWAVDARDKVAQRVTADADTPPSEGGRFWKIKASSAAEAIDRALARVLARVLSGR